MDARRNIPLIVGLAIPIVMILFVAGSIILPGAFVQPKYNFLYSTGERISYRASFPVPVPGDSFISEDYLVRDGKLTKEETLLPIKNGPHLDRRDNIRFYVHDVRKNESVPISFAQAQTLTLDVNSEAPDGFEVARGGGGGGFFPFFLVGDADHGSYYLKGRGARHKLNLKRTGDRYSSEDFRFFGWILTPGTPTP